MDVDDFAPRLSFFFNAHIDFFEEIAKYRAARRIWARELRDRYGATGERSLLMRFHTQTAGRVADGPAARGEHRPHGARGAGGGARRHPVAAHELLRRGARAPDRGRRPARAAHAAGDRARDRRRARRPTRSAARGSSSRSTDRLEREAYDYFERIDRLGGVVAALNENFFQREIAEASYRFQREVEEGRRLIVGVNSFLNDDDDQVEILRISPERGAAPARAAERACAAGATGAAVEAALAARSRRSRRPTRT